MSELRDTSFVNAVRRWAGRPGRGGSLRTQLILWNVLALALLLGALGLVVRYTVRSFLTTSVDRQLAEQAALIRPPGWRGGPPPQQQRPPPDGPGAGDAPFGPPPFERDGQRRRFGPPPPFFMARNDDPYRVHHFDLQGNSVVKDDDRPMWDADGFDRAKRQGQSVYSTITINGESVRMLSDPVRERGTLVGVAQIGHPMTDVYLALAGLDRALLTMIPVGLFCAGLGGAYLTSRVLRRVRGATRAAERISANDFSARLPVAGDDEFSELADTFNSLLDRLEGAFQQQERLLQQQRRFTADASHELKTPLTVIKGTASMALSAGKPTEHVYRSSLQDIDQAADLMSHLVRDLLLLAHSDAGQLGRNRIEVLVAEILRRASAVVHHQQAAVEIIVDDETLSVVGNEQELVRLFSNLIDNAANYTPADGKISVRAWGGGADVTITVTDTGVGIAPEHLPHLGERFYRADAARSRPDGGTGLGLSICRSIVEAHGGAFAIESALGQGTTVRVTLPRQ